MGEDQLRELERVVNSKIIAGLKMYPTLYDGPEDPELKKLTSVSTKEFADFQAETFWRLIKRLELTMMINQEYLVHGGICKLTFLEMRL